MRLNKLKGFVQLVAARMRLSIIDRRREAAHQGGIHARAVERAVFDSQHSDSPTKHFLDLISLSPARVTISLSTGSITTIGDVFHSPVKSFESGTLRDDHLDTDNLLMPTAPNDWSPQLNSSTSDVPDGDLRAMDLTEETSHAEVQSLRHGPSAAHTESPSDPPEANFETRLDSHVLSPSTDVLDSEVKQPSDGSAVNPDFHSNDDELIASPPPVLVEPEVPDPFIVDDGEDSDSDTGHEDETLADDPPSAADEIALAPSTVLDPASSQPSDEPLQSPVPAPIPQNSVNVDKAVPSLPSLGSEEEEEEEAPELYLPGLIIPTMFLPIPNVRIFRCLLKSPYLLSYPI